MVLGGPRRLQQEDVVCPSLSHSGGRFRLPLPAVREPDRTSEEDGTRPALQQQMAASEETTALARREVLADSRMDRDRSSGDQTEETKADQWGDLLHPQ